MDFVDDFDGEIKPNTDYSELNYLRKECKISNNKLTEIDNRRNGNKAIRTMDWLLFTFGKRAEAIEESLLELSFLVVWFKLVALLKQADDEDYLIVKQNWLLIHQTYNEVMDREMAWYRPPVRSVICFRAEAVPRAPADSFAQLSNVNLYLAFVCSDFGDESQ